jgi:hypothetical protein
MFWNHWHIYSTWVEWFRVQRSGLKKPRQLVWGMTEIPDFDYYWEQHPSAATLEP